MLRAVSRVGARAAAGWLAVALLIVFQWGLFRTYVAREVAWAYPAYSDQVAALSRSYEIHARIRSGGLITGLREGLDMTGASGTLLPLQAAVLHRLFGPSRLSALAVSFLYFAAFQAVLVATLLWLTGRWSLAFLGLGLLLTVRSPFLPVGGLADFRLDSAAASLMGVFLCLAIRSRTFKGRSWSLVAGMGAALLVMVRTLALVYLAGILAAFAALTLWRGRNGSAAPDAGAWRRRRSGLLAASLVLGALSFPLVWHKWQRIHDYYVVGHVTGPNKWIHPRQLGLRTLGDVLLYYPISLLRDHAGPRFLLASVVVLAMSGVASRWAGPAKGHDPDWGPAFAFVGLAFAVPLAILTGDIAKSPVVAGILIPPTLWLVLLGAVRWTGSAWSGPAAPWPGHALRVLCLVVLGLGLGTQWEAFAGPGPHALPREDIEAAKALHRMIGESSLAMGWSSPLVTADRLADFIVPSIATTEMVERRGIFLKVRFGVWEYGEISQARALDSIARSDFVVLTTSRQPESFPFDSSMRELHPALVQACERDHVPMGRFTIQGIEVVPYVRAALRVEGGRGGAIPQEGLVLSGLGPVLRSRPRLELRGVSDSPPGAGLEISAEARGRTGASRPVDAALDLSGRSYRIRIELPEGAFDPESPLEVRVRLGDPRLRLRMPAEVLLSPRLGAG